jgi:hypothetical protein
MTPGKFLLLTTIAVVLTTLAKLFFIRALNIDNVYIVYLFWLVIALISIACSRRLGVISYIEATLVLALWLILTLFLDLLITAAVAGIDIYRHPYLWVSHGVMVITIFLFHKKRHVEVRHMQRAAKLPPQR